MTKRSFNEADVVRDDQGQFAEKPGGNGNATFLARFSAKVGAGAPAKTAPAKATMPATLPAKKGVSLARREPKVIKPLAAPAPTKTFATLTPAQADQMQQQMTRGKPWTPAERGALRRYTGDDYVGINTRARTGKGGKPADAKAIPHMRSAMRPTTQDIVVHRNHVGAHRMGFPDDVAARIQAVEDVTQAELDSVIGRSFHDKGFSSTSIGKRGFSAISLKISVPAGTRAAYVESVTQNLGETEVVLDTGTHYKITGVTRDKINKAVTMHVTVVGQDD